jgi:hypothetical protein
MIKKICDSCKKQLGRSSVSISNDFSFDKKDFCSKCSKPAADYLKKVFDEFFADTDPKK